MGPPSKKPDRFQDQRVRVALELDAARARTAIAMRVLAGSAAYET